MKIPDIENLQKQESFLFFENGTEKGDCNGKEENTSALKFIIQKYTGSILTMNSNPASDNETDGGKILFKEKKMNIPYFFIMLANTQTSTSGIADISSSAESILTGLLSAVGAGFALWGGFDVATGFSQHNAAKQEAGIPKLIGGVAVIAMATTLIPEIFKFLNF